MDTSGLNQGQFSLYVKITHQIPYGKALFIVGNTNQLGNWKPLASNRLEWSQGNTWRKMFNINKNQRIQYKYVIGDYDANSQDIQWQAGTNRVIGQEFTNQKQLFLNQRWNLVTISIQLSTDSEEEIEEVYILGNCVELGMKISKRLMTKSNSIASRREPSNQIWEIRFNVDKFKSCLNYYYYAKKVGKSIEKIRQPGRYFYFCENDSNNLVDRQKIINYPGEIRVIEHQNFKGFKISKLNSNIFIGPYVKKREDLEVLKQNNVKAILNLQSDMDMSKYKVDWDWIKQAAEEYQISAFNFQIVDMNFNDFINKSSQALKILRKLIDAYGCVYVHCTAGIYRSPQLAILYLVKFENYKLGDAMTFVKQKRPYAHPYFDCLKWALQKIYTQIDRIKNHLSIKSFFAK